MKGREDIGEWPKSFDVRKCARCQGEHEDVKFHKLDNSEEFDGWGFCPAKGQPILLIIRVENE